MRSIPAKTALLALSTGCGAVLGTMRRSAGTDRVFSHVAEPDARIFCGGAVCDSVQSERAYRDRYSKPWFIAGSGIDLALAAGGGYLAAQDLNVGSGAVLTIGALFVAFDAYYLGSGAFAHHQGPWHLTDDATVEWHGTRTPITFCQLARDDSVAETFSIAAIRASVDRDPASCRK